MNRSVRLVSLAVLLFTSVWCANAQDSGQVQSPPTYKMELVYIFDVDSTEFIFVIGKTGFRSIESLKKFLSDLPAGATLEWAPGCLRMGGEPLLSSEQEMEDFKAFCVERNINFILVPSG